MEKTKDWVDAPFPKMQDDEYETQAWGLKTIDSKHEPFTIYRPKPTGKLIKFDLLYTGICHSDIHWGENDLTGCRYPFVGGHEIIG